MKTGIFRLSSVVASSSTFSLSPFPIRILLRLVMYMVSRNIAAAVRYRANTRYNLLHRWFVCDVIFENSFVRMSQLIDWLVDSWVLLLLLLLLLLFIDVCLDVSIMFVYLLLIFLLMKNPNITNAPTNTHTQSLLGNYRLGHSGYIYRNRLLKMYHRQQQQQPSTTQRRASTNTTTGSNHASIQVDLAHIGEYDVSLLNYVRYHPVTTLPVLEAAASDALQTMIYSAAQRNSDGNGTSNIADMNETMTRVEMEIFAIAVPRTRTHPTQWAFRSRYC